MPTTIKLRNSVTTTSAPSSLVQGEVAINITDKKVWVGNAATTPIQLLGDGGSASFTSIAFGSGTVSSPSITFTGDTNTGIYSPAADTIAFTEGGVESMRIDSSGNVGIGTSSPYNKLETNVSGGATVGIANSSSGAGILYGKLAFYSTVAAGAYAEYGGQIRSYSGVGIDYGDLRFYTANGATTAERMRIDSSGNVGIGTSSPTVRLQTNGAVAIQGTAAFPSSGAGIELYYDTTNGSHMQSYDRTASAWKDLRLNSGLTVFSTAGSERMRITSGGNVGIGLSSPTYRLQVAPGTYSDQLAVFNEAGTWTSNGGVVIADYYDNTTLIGGIKISASTATSGFLTFHTGGTTERMRIDSSGNLLIGVTSTASRDTTAGIYLGGAVIQSNRSGAATADFGRLTNDGDIVVFRQDGTVEGSISVSGTTVSYNGGHLSRWSQLPNNQKDDTILKGTVMSNLDDMCVWVKDGEELPNEQLNKMKVSDVEGDTNVAGVFVNWTFDEQCQSDDMNIAMTGDMIIRIAQGVVVQKGDLLMSAGDGTAKPQGDDIRRSKTVAKVTSNHITCTYADGSYCVPCVLMAC